MFCAKRRWRAPRCARRERPSRTGGSCARQREHASGSSKHSERWIARIHYDATASSRRPKSSSPARASSDPDSPRIAAFEEQLQTSRLDAERASERERQAAQAISTARATFASGQRQAAVDDLRAFLAREPDASGVSAEIDRLEAEAHRQQLIEQRLAEATRDAEAAEAALEGGRARTGAEAGQSSAGSGSRSASWHNGSPGWQRLVCASWLRPRRAQLKRHGYLLEARDLLRRGKYQKARGAVDKAAQLNPASEEVPALLAQIDAEEARDNGRARTRACGAATGPGRGARCRDGPRRGSRETTSSVRYGPRKMRSPSIPIVRKRDKFSSGRGRNSKHSPRSPMKPSMSRRSAAAIRKNRFAGRAASAHAPPSEYHQTMDQLEPFQSMDDQSGSGPRSRQ